MTDASNRSRWLRGASVQDLDYNELLSKILRTASSPLTDADSGNATATVLMATQVSRAKQAALQTSLEETTTQPPNSLSASTDQTESSTREPKTTTSTAEETTVTTEGETNDPQSDAESETTRAAVIPKKTTYTPAKEVSSTELDYVRLPDEPDIVRSPPSHMPPRGTRPLASVLSDEAIERVKRESAWSNFLDIYPRKSEEPTELELSRLDSSNRLKPIAIDGVPRHSPYAFYSSFSETVPTLHQSILSSGGLAGPALLTPVAHQWWQSPYLIYGLVILFLAVLVMSMTLQCCVIFSQRRQIEYLRDESVRSRTCASIPSYLVRVPANTEVMGPRISDAVVPSATTNVGNRTLDELVDEVERRITKQLIKYNQRSLPPDVRSSGDERTPDRRVPSARANSVRPPRARITNSGVSSSTSFSPHSVVRVDQQPSLSSTRSLEAPSEMLSVALGGSSSSPGTSSSLTQGRKAPRSKAASRMS